jgi:DNA-binding NarL/FixJ family response regulator
MKLSVVIADDHPIVLRGLHALIEENGSFHVVATAADGAEAFSVIKSLRPDIAVLDLTMPKMTGLEVLTALRKTNLATRVVLLAASATDLDIYHAVDGKISGFLLKEAAPDELIHCLLAVARGETWFAHDIVDPALARVSDRRDKWLHLSQTLTAREREFVSLVMRRMSNKEIAFALGLSEGTVKVHLNNIFRKLRVSTRGDILELAGDVAEVAKSPGQRVGAFKSN